MTTVNFKTKLETLGCINFRHLSLFTILTLLSLTASAITMREGASRSPASAFEEEVLTVPLEQKVMIQSLFAEDDAGVMKGTRDQLNSWEETEEYSKKWDLESTNLYKTPTTSDKTNSPAKNTTPFII